MNAAAIDIGSNAVRMIIGAPDENGGYRSLKQKRYPLRLGKESFPRGMFDQESFEQASLFLGQIAQTMKDHSVFLCLCTGTSALRMATNRQLLIDQIKKQFQISINTIQGDLEGWLVTQAILHRSPEPSKLPHLLVDIGGGSTEIILCQKNSILVAISVNVGTINFLQQENKRENLLKNLAAKISEHILPLIKDKKKVLITGVGGSLRSLGKLNKILFSQKNTTQLLPEELAAINESILHSDEETRVDQWGLSLNRSQLILPASHIFSTCLKEIPWEKISLPRVGLVDGLMDLLTRQLHLSRREGKALGDIEVEKHKLTISRFHHPPSHKDLKT